eukprot:4393142-Karenia_brevis.AAC.1
MPLQLMIVTRTSNQQMLLGAAAIGNDSAPVVSNPCLDHDLSSMPRFCPHGARPVDQNAYA